MAAPIQPAAETPVLVGGYTGQEKSSPGGEPCSPVARFGPVSSISFCSQPTVQPGNEVHGTDHQAEDFFMEAAYSVFLPSGV